MLESSITTFELEKWDPRIALFSILRFQKSWALLLATRTLLFSSKSVCSFKFGLLDKLQICRMKVDSKNI